MIEYSALSFMYLGVTSRSPQCCGLFGSLRSRLSDPNKLGSPFGPFPIADAKCSGSYNKYLWNLFGIDKAIKALCYINKMLLLKRCSVDFSLLIFHFRCNQVEAWNDNLMAAFIEQTFHDVIPRHVAHLRK